MFTIYASILRHSHMANRDRPLSPHLQIYRWQAQMTSSTLHRISGMINALGALVFVIGLAHLASGADSWARFVECIRSPLGFAFLFVWSWSISYHLLNGIRHVVQDAGYGYSIPAFVRSSWISMIGSLVLTVIIWLIVMATGGAA